MISEKKNLFKSIDNSPFDDPFYLSISSLTQNKIKLRKDDLLEFEANLFLDRGRLVFRKSGKFYFTERGSDPAPNKSDLLDDNSDREPNDLCMNPEWQGKHCNYTI